MEKLRLILCDDNKQEAEYYAGICRAVCDRNTVPAELKIFTNVNDLLFDIEDPTFLSLVGIMIVEPGSSFAATPVMVRANGYDGMILYLSHVLTPEYCMRAFDAGAYNFMQKGTDPSNLSRFESVLELALQATRRLNRQYLLLNCVGEYKQVEVKEIQYFEAIDKMVVVEYTGGRFQFVSTIQSLEERLRYCGFARVHRSYIVAIDAIHRLAYEEVMLNNGRTIPVGRNYYASVKSVMNRWQL